MAEFFPDAILTIAYIPTVYYFQVEPVIAWFSLAQSWYAESGTYLQNAKYNPSRGEAQSVPETKRQDTWISSTGRSGRQFNVLNGSWRDDAYNLQIGGYGLCQQNGGNTVGFPAGEVVSVDQTTDIEDTRIILRLGYAPVEGMTGAPQTHTSANSNCYIHFAYQSPDNIDYRFAGEYGQPMRLDVTYDGGMTWQIGVAVARNLPSLERYLATHSNEIHLHVKIDQSYKRIELEVGDGVWLTHSPDPKQIHPPKNFDPTQGPVDHLLPVQGNIRLIQQGGTCSFWYYPARYNAITLNKSARDMGQVLSNANNAVLSFNALTPPNDNQTTTGTITTDGQVFSYQVFAQTVDAGDGLGGNQAAVLSDVTLIIPSVWDTTVPGADPGSLDGTEVLRGMRVEELEVFDDVTRTATYRAFATINNKCGIYSGSYGDVALEIDAANLAGDDPTYYTRVTGVAGFGLKGVEFARQDPVMLMKLPVADKSVMMQIALNDEITLDNWALPSAVRFLCDKGNIHSDFISDNIPLYITPNGTPYGEAGEDCPYYILGAGVGNTPRYRYYPQQTPWEILCDLVLKFNDIDPTTGLPVQYYHGFDPYGIYHFEPVAFYDNAITANYSDVDPIGLFQIEELQVFNSVEDMRTELNFQGLDSLTYELLYYHLPLPPYVSVAKGFRDTWMERNSQFASLDYLEYIAQAASIQASLPQQVIVMKVPFQPSVHAGDQCTITESAVIGGSLYAEIKSIRSVYGHADTSGQRGEMENYSIVTARPILNTI